jgi:plastocyanin
MKTVIAIIVAVIVIGGGVILLTNNNSDKNKSTSTGTTASPDNSTPNKSSSSTNTNSVTISDFSFNPADITVKKGTTVTWTNQDQTAHTVTETDGQDGPKSGQLNKGGSYAFTFSTVGTFKYACSIHPEMTGQVTVVE